MGASVWLDGVRSTGNLVLAGNNLVTGLPPRFRSPASAFRTMRGGRHAVGNNKFVLRPYHLDDSLRGAADKGGRICGRDATPWLLARGLATSNLDVFELPLYPVLAADRITQDLVDWFFDEKPDAAVSKRLADAELLSAAQIPQNIDFARLYAERNAAHEEFLIASFEACLTTSDTRVMEQDFSAIADLCKGPRPAPAPLAACQEVGPAQRAHASAASFAPAHAALGNLHGPSSSPS